jgi:formylglycine-generating enzyme required for sulfatase activity
MVFVKGGSMNLGCNSGSGSFGGNEKPIHNVTLSDYYMGETEVTQALWKAVMGYGNNPSNWKGDQLPVEIVSWNDCERFVSLLNNLLAGQLPNGYSFSLPSEAQWEYAARGGQKSSGNTYAGSSNVGSVAWYDGNSNSRTHEVKQKNPNELGLYDMSGNVCEWCEDWYDYYWYSYNKKWTDPVNKFGTSSDGHVLRGGSWRGEASYSRVSCRANSSPSFRNSHIGFRLALVRR